jgi:hypothetical protein
VIWQSSKATYSERDRSSKRSWETGRECGERDFEACGLLSLAEVARRENDHTRASELVQEGLAVAVDLGSVGRIVQALEIFAALAVTDGAPARAARLIGAAEQLRLETGFAIYDDPRRTTG